MATQRTAPQTKSPKKRVVIHLKISKTNKLTNNTLLYATPPKAKQPIKDAALRLFVEQGIDATGIREIAQDAGYSEAALYRHWTNKEDLVLHLFREHLQEVVGRLDTQLLNRRKLLEQTTSSHPCALRALR